MNQRESVYSAVVAVKGNVSGKVELTTEERARVVGLVCEAFDAGEVTFKETDANKNKLADEKELRKYVVGLVNNWLRKDPNLNGGEKYEAKNPGTRSSDAQLKNLNLLLKATTDETKQQKIQSFIDKRKQELVKTKAVEIDMDLIPEELKEIL